MLKVLRLTAEIRRYTIGKMDVRGIGMKMQFRFPETL